MSLNLLLFVVGCAIMYFGSEYLIDSSIKISKRFKISTIVIGATVIALGTSLPELIVSFYSIAFLENSSDSSGIIIGNILGSNIANVSLVVGYCAIAYTLNLNFKVINDFIFILILGIYTLVCLQLNLTINYIHGIILLLALIIFIYKLIKSDNLEDFNDLNDNDSNFLWTITIIFLCIISLLVGSHLIVNNATKIAEYFEISSLTIGVTIIALGTSLPELFTGVLSVKKKQYKLFIGNIVGSNILNIVFVLGFSSLITDLKPSINQNNLFYISFVLVVSHLVLIISYLTTKSISRFSGFLLLLLYLFFLYNII